MPTSAIILNVKCQDDYSDRAEANNDNNDTHVDALKQRKQWWKGHKPKSSVSDVENDIAEIMKHVDMKQ